MILAKDRQSEFSEGTESRISQSLFLVLVSGANVKRGFDPLTSELSNRTISPKEPRTLAVFRRGLGSPVETKRRRLS